MTATNVFHALGLHMHHHSGNLDPLLETDRREAEQFVRCYDRVARYAPEYRHPAHMHVGFSGNTLEQLRALERYPGLSGDGT